MPHTSNAARFALSAKRPLRDLNPTRCPPFCTYGLIAINILVFLWEQTFSVEGLQRVFFNLAVVPANISQHPLALESIFDILRSMFFHGDWLHIGGNMLYLYLFGDNIEDRFGWPLYLFLYFASGFAAVYAQVIIVPTSTIPLVGASGAIAGVLGSYLILYLGVRGIVPSATSPPVPNGRLGPSSSSGLDSKSSTACCRLARQCHYDGR